jgi:hypothetical protein
MDRERGFLSDISGGAANLRKASSVETFAIGRDTNARSLTEKSMGVFAGSAVMSILARRKFMIDESDSSGDDDDDDDDGDWDA